MTNEKRHLFKFYRNETFISLENIHHYKKETSGVQNTLHRPFKKLGANGFVSSSKALWSFFLALIY